jgi:HEAT repeat protein
MDWLSAIAVLSRPPDPEIEAGFRALRASVDAADRETRLRMLRQLAVQSTPVALAVLVAATADSDPLVRREALERLRFCDAGWARREASHLAVGTLRKSLQSSSYWVRQAALETLHRIAMAQLPLPPAAGEPAGDAPSLPPATLLLRTASDPDRNLRLACCEALARLGGVEAAAGLKQFEKDADEHVRSAAQVLPNRAGTSPLPNCAP